MAFDTGTGSQPVMLFDADDFSGPAPGTGYDDANGGGYDDEMADAEDNAEEDYARGLNLDDALHLQGDSLLAGSFGLDDIVGEAQDAPIKKFRVAGGRVAVAKKISADLDSDDDMLVQMREAGCTDMQIADALANSGRVRYDKKTIASRYARIKDKMARREDQRLEDELTDWHEGEDVMLLAAVRHADFLIADEARKLRKRRFQYTAKHLSELKPSTNYSAKACRKRYRDLMNDRAKIPPELDDEPEKRADEKAARILRHLEKQATQRAADLEAQERAKVEEEGQQMQLVQRQLAVAERKEAEEAERMARIQEAMEKKQKKIDDINRKKTDRQNRMALLNRQSEKRQSVIQKQREAGATFNAAAAAQAKAQADADRKKNIARMIMVQRQSATPARSTRASTATPSRRGRGRGGAGARGKGGKKSGKVAENEKATPAAEAFKSADFVEGSDDDAANAEPDAAIAEMNLEVEANDMDEELYGEPSELPSAGKDTAYATPTSVGKFHLGALSSSNKAPTASPSSSRASSVSPRNDSSPAVAGSPLNTPIPPKAAAPRVLRSASKKPSPLSKATSANGVKFQEASTAAANKTGKGGKGGVKRASNDDDEEMLDDVDVGGASQAET